MVQEKVVTCLNLRFWHHKQMLASWSCYNVERLDPWLLIRVILLLFFPLFVALDPTYHSIHALVLLGNAQPQLLELLFDTLSLHLHLLLESVDHWVQLERAGGVWEFHYSVVGTSVLVGVHPRVSGLFNPSLLCQLFSFFRLDTILNFHPILYGFRLDKLIFLLF